MWIKTDFVSLFTSVPLKLKEALKLVVIPVKLLSMLVASYFRGIRFYSVSPLQKFAGAVMCQEQSPDKNSSPTCGVFLLH